MSAQGRTKRGQYAYANPFGWNVTKDSKKPYRQRVRKKDKESLRRKIREATE